MRAHLLVALLVVGVAACSASRADPPQSARGSETAAPTIMSTPGAISTATPGSTAVRTGGPPPPPPVIPAPQGVGPRVPTATPRSTVSTIPGASLTRVLWEGLVFDVPSSWVFRPANLDEHYTFIVGFLGTAPSIAEC